MNEQPLGVIAGDQPADLIGAVALDHHGRIDGWLVKPKEA